MGFFLRACYRADATPVWGVGKGKSIARTQHGASRGGLSSYACNVLVIHYLQITDPPVIPVLQQLGQQEPKLVYGCKVYFFNNIDELISCISGASRGGLSSYACNVLVIHYLQNTDPPVIPVLQQLGQQEPKLVYGCKVYFFNNIDELESVWSGKGQNHQSVGELWVGLLRYYAEFNIKKYVVSIRAKTPVTRLQKRWQSEFMAIEEGEFINSLNKGMMRCEKPITQPAGQYVTLGPAAVV
ncbi:hypothetical protein HPB51_025253 [Rhipicephalus microplus]|uniref:PAP-associated domain-containing protein n=1 Tax=Rhipicephalus microplus TaxID=6941 RepID=A0A9J6D7V9_RHIMP|nr:hypothetical protein HPB51_025253 [Rhipicephalus microplus]